MARPILGVIGGSGLYDLPGLTGVRRERVATPFGEPSDEYLIGRLGEQEMVFLPRHGKGHRLSPTEVNSRANVHGMKQLGVTRLISVSAVGSMREEIAPGELVLVDQFIDRTVARPQPHVRSASAAPFWAAARTTSRAADTLRCIVSITCWTVTASWPSRQQS